MVKGYFRLVTHRIDDLEVEAILKTHPKIVTHRIDDLEVCSWGTADIRLLLLIR